ncbi:MAG: serine/threonine-protein kinase HipA [Paraglaciecola sp.]|jgi:serine/threonine-protein kinase HipA
MTLALQCGLNVPAVDIIYFPEPAYIVQRFDRKGRHPHQQRLHMLDGCQLLGTPPRLSMPTITLRAWLG